MNVLTTLTRLVATPDATDQRPIGPAVTKRARKTGEIRSLTGLRGVAACLVMAFHASLPRVPGDGGVVLTVIQHGYLWVDFFFVLSGFVMALTYGRDFIKDGSVQTFWRFVSHRIARVWPLYIFASVIMLPFSHKWIAGAGTALAVAGRILTNLLMVQNWGFNWSMNLNAWSISTEWLAYMLFPLLLWISLRAGKAAAVAVAATCAGILCALALLPDVWIWRGGLYGTDPYSANPISRCLTEFTLGILVFRISGTDAGRAVSGQPVVSMILCVLLAVLFAIPGREILIVLLFPALVLSLCADRGIVARALGSRPLHWLGVLSYSIYLMHLFFNELHWHLQWRLTAAGYVHAKAISITAMMVGSIIGSSLTLRYVEKPGRTFLRRVLEPGRPATR